MTNLATLEQSATGDIETAPSPQALEEVRVKLLGKKGLITQQLKELGSASVEEKKTKGKALNQLKQSIAAAIETREAELKRDAMNARLQTETLDITLPPRPSPAGSTHPISAVIDEVTDIFAELGFSIADGPQIEDDWHNFEALNIPPSHPARQMHDTFYLHEKDEKGDPLVLRTHTSPVQIRAMKERGAPLRIIAPGPTYRCDSDMTHTPMFHQVEGLVVEEGIHFGHLKGCVQQFLAAFFGRDDVPLRFRPSFFPFTEPSAEVDIGCKHTRDGLLIGEGDDWMEIMGCGMVHPKVLKASGIDTTRYQGFAFGAGIERLAMLKYNIPDLRTFFDSDARWLSHYNLGGVA